jgi:2-polyprenyl-3-methyl-5-hydroxy-6-metoxy-1,4-benzoquinol methylase
MSAASRLQLERQFHDSQARDRAVTFERQPARLQFTDDQYLDHQPWVRAAFAQLGDIRNKRILDLGCGHGMAAIVMARRAAKVTASDLSTEYCTEVQKRAAANQVEIDVVGANAERLPFADRSFDVVWGHAILHHLDLKVAAREVCRVMQPDGVAVFSEPWDGNPLVKILRSTRRHTKHERAFSTEDVTVLSSIMERVDVSFYQWRRYAVITCSPS